MAKSTINGSNCYPMPSSYASLVGVFGRPGFPPPDPSWQNPAPLLAAEAMRVHLRYRVNILARVWKKITHVIFTSKECIYIYTYIFNAQYVYMYIYVCMYTYEYIYRLYIYIYIHRYSEVCICSNVLKVYVYNVMREIYI